VSGNWDYINGVFEQASELSEGGHGVYAPSTLVSSEESGTVSFSSADLGYQPARVVTSGPFKVVLGAVFSTEPVLRLVSTDTSDHGKQPFAQVGPQAEIAFYVTEQGYGGDVSVSLVIGVPGVDPENPGNYMSDVETAANVIYGVGPGVVSESALYAISLGVPALG
jgi:hypothetical protein